MSIRLEYEVSKEKGGQYYVHLWGCPHSAIKGSY